MIDGGVVGRAVVSRTYGSDSLVLLRQGPAVQSGRFTIGGGLSLDMGSGVTDGVVHVAPFTPELAANMLDSNE